MLQYDIKQSPPNTVIVEVGTAIDDTVTFGKLTIHIDPLFNPTHYARIYGRVIAVPDRQPVTEHGVPIDDYVKTGDLIYFHYLTTNDEANCIYGNYYKVPYYWIFCAIRDGNIHPVGSWTLLEKYVEEEFNTVEVGGQKMEATVSASGLVTGVFKKPSQKYATVVHIGQPLRGEPDLGIKKGDKVVLEKNSNFENEIEGKKYYTVKQEYIVGKASI
jgi:co-chaperonin GroES (HSP10)